jgi:excisionase family DNA binding protein
VNLAVRTAIRLPAWDRRAALDLRELPPTLTVEQVAAILGCGRTLAYELIRRGASGSTRAGSRLAPAPVNDEFLMT